jgi:hypothetical protein
VMYSLLVLRAPASARDIGGEGPARPRAAGRVRTAALRGSWGARAHAHDNNRNTRPSPPSRRPGFERKNTLAHPPHTVWALLAGLILSHCAATARLSHRAPPCGCASLTSSIDSLAHAVMPSR